MLFFFTLLGLMIGSFLNVVILRSPKSQSISFPASHCPTCKHELKWFHNIPLFSYIFLRGKCAFCKEKISIQYPLVEISSMLVFFIVGLKNGLGYYDFVLNSLFFSSFFLALCFCFLIALSMIDFVYQAVPDSVSLPTLLFSFLSALLSYSVFNLEHIQNVFSNILILMGAFALLRILVSSITKKEAMGEADTIIAGVIGAIVGVKLGFVAVYASAIFALIGFMICRKKDITLPYIPFLSLGLFFVYIFQEEVLNLLSLIYA